MKIVGPSASRRRSSRVDGSFCRAVVAYRARVCPAIAAVHVTLVVLFLGRMAGAQQPPPSTLPPPPTSSAPAAQSAPVPAPAAPPEGEGPTTKPADAEIVFHARAPDAETLAAGSMQQIRFGSVKSRYSMNIFGDVDFFAGNDASAAIPGFPAAGPHPSFSLGTLSFLITGELERHFVSTAEFAMEHDAQNQLGVDIERLQVGWMADHFFVYAGRVHTAFGYWSNAYHHGKWLQPTMDRPRWIAFEDQGGLLPIHTVGLSAGPIIDVGAGKVKLTASVSNGRGHVVDDIRNKFDYQDGKAVHLQAEYIGVGGSELRLGLSGTYDRIPAADGVMRPALPQLDEYIFGAHLAYPSYPLLFIVEGYYVAHHVDNQLYRTFGGFATIARSFGIITPYVRGQWIGTAGGTDPFFVPDPRAADAPVIEELEGLGGVRFDLTDWTALRAEYRATKLGSADLAHLGMVQWCWGF